MKLLKVDTIDEARNKILNHVKSWQLKTQTIAVTESQNRILAEDVFASCDIPSFNRSTVDGYAVIASDTSGATDSIPVLLKQTGSVSMGKEVDFSICSGECAYVPTGAMLPNGTDAVVMIEYCESAGETIAVYESVAVGSGMITIGEDFKKGKLLLKKGTLIRPQEIGALSAAGITNVNVYIQLTLCIFSTGDELVDPQDDPAPGEVRDINTNMLRALIVKHGYDVVLTQVFLDDETLLEAAVKEAMKKCDIVMISGGSSQGDKDFTAKVFNRVAKPGVFTHGLALKPGKPTILGWDEDSKTLLVGLPGHPVSAMMVFTLLFSTGIIHHNDSAFPIPARISCNVPGAPGKILCQPIVLKLMNDFYFAEPVFGKAGMISTLTQADGFIIIDMNKEGLKKDEPVLVHLF